MYYQYAYDELGQLIREDNRDANKSYTYSYDSRGNILEKKTYAFTLGTLGTAQMTDSYGYATDSWKDRLTSYNGQTITYDAIGNPLTYNNGSAYIFTWEGRQMQSATKDLKTWTYTYNSDGLRTGKTNGTTTYTYTWNENRQLSSMVCGTSSAWFYYDHEGKPLYMEYADGNDECSGTYRYILNLQGDVVGLYDLTRDCMAMTYTYDAWGRELSWSTLNSGYAGLLYGNPLTYRGYIYDRETGFYYLQSRYYDPTIGRFLNADDTQYLGASGTLLSLNLFVYCENDAITNVDKEGTSLVSFFVNAFRKCFPKNTDIVIYYYSKKSNKNMDKIAYQNLYTKSALYCSVESANDLERSLRFFATCKNIRNIYLYVHGGEDALHMYGQDMTDFSSLIPLNISGKIYLFSCRGARTVAEKIAMYTQTTVVACYYKVSFEHGCARVGKKDYAFSWFWNRRACWYQFQYVNGRVQKSIYSYSMYLPGQYCIHIPQSQWLLIC